MTHDQVDSVQGDIAYLKTLASQGRDTPLLVGPVLVTAALIFGAATAIQWGISSGLVALSSWGVLWVWIGAGIAFSAALWVIIRKMGTQAGAGSARNRTIGAAWSACGYSIFATWLSLMAYGFSTGSWAAMSLMPTIVMVAYGSAWMIAGLVVERKWMAGVALLSYAGAVAMAWFANTHMIFGVYLLLLSAVALVPGLYLMRQNKGQV